MLDNSVVKKLIEIRQKSDMPLEITVRGISMLPVLKQGDIITVKKQDNYNQGDILAFNYKYNELLVHRLLISKNNKYYCKGDNAFRLEDIELSQIVGKVIAKNTNGKTVKIRYHKMKLMFFCYFSMKINKVFVKSRYNVDKTKQSAFYRLFHMFYLSRNN